MGRGGLTRDAARADLRAALREYHAARARLRAAALARKLEDALAYQAVAAAAERRVLELNLGGGATRC